MVKRVCETCGFTEEKEDHAVWKHEFKGIRKGRCLCSKCYMKETAPERAEARKKRKLRSSVYSINGEF